MLGPILTVDFALRRYGHGICAFAVLWLHAGVAWHGTSKFSTASLITREAGGLYIHLRRRSLDVPGLDLQGACRASSQRASPIYASSLSLGHLRLCHLCSRALESLTTRWTEGLGLLYVKTAVGRLDLSRCVLRQRIRRARLETAFYAVSSARYAMSFLLGPNHRRQCRCRFSC